MSKYRVGFIGNGRPWKTEGATGFGMNHAHAKGYRAHPATQLVATCDVFAERAELFAKEHGVEKVYTDYQKMLKNEKLDIVSISTWPHLHCEMVLAAAEAGVKAIHCEKPMALTWGDAKRMVQACRDAGVQLTFNHQRRFGEPFRRAKELLKSGAIGDLVRLEGCCGDLFDWGTHWFDMMFFYNDETPVDWVIGQIDLRGSRHIFGAPAEGQAISHFKFRNGVRGLMIAGHEASIGAGNRLVGTEGTIEVGVSNSVNLRFWGRGMSGWQVIPTAEGLHSDDMIRRGIFDLISSLETKREPELAARKALQATEVIFATYESARRRGRVDLPLDIDDSPIIDMLDKAGIEWRASKEVMAGALPGGKAPTASAPAAPAAASAKKGRR